MKTKLKTILFVIAITPLSSQSQALNSNVWQTHINRDFGFRLSYPNEWKVIPPKGPNVRISVSPPQGPGNCNVVVKPMAELKSYSQRQLNREMEAMPLDNATWADMMDMPQSQIRVIEQRRTKVADVSALYGEVEVQLDNLNGRYFGKKAIAFMMTPGGRWSVTCGVSAYELSEGRQRYGELQPYLKKIMESFSFVDVR